MSHKSCGILWGWKQEWLRLSMLGTKICHELVLWFDLDGWILASGLLISASYIGPADSIPPPLLHTKLRSIPKNSSKIKEWSPPGQFQYRRERDSMNLYGVTGWLMFTWARHPSSWPIRGHCSSETFSPGPLLHWFNYTCNWPSFLGQDILPAPKQPTNISECRALQGGFRKRTTANILHQEKKTIYGGCGLCSCCYVSSETLGCWVGSLRIQIMSQLCLPGKCKAN